MAASPNTMSAPPPKTDTKVSSSWSNIEEFPDESSLPKTTKREKKRSKTGKSEKRELRIVALKKRKHRVRAKKNRRRALNSSPSKCETK